MPVSVLHNIPVWLGQTQTWIWTQIQHPPADRFVFHVACQRTENLEQFLS